MHRVLFIFLQSHPNHVVVYRRNYFLCVVLVSRMACVSRIYLCTRQDVLWPQLRKACACVWQSHIHCVCYLQVWRRLKPPRYTYSPIAPFHPADKRTHKADMQKSAGFNPLWHGFEWNQSVLILLICTYEISVSPTSLRSSLCRSSLRSTIMC